MKFFPIAHYLWRHSFVRFAVVGGLGYLLAILLLAVFTGALKLEFAAANALTIFLTMVCTWLGNRYFTFADRRARSLAGASQEWLKFMGANGLGALINYLAALALVHYADAPFSNKFVAQAIGVLTGLVFNFTLSRTLVFRTSP
ncbi:MAG TPA: GtrA family protein [Rhizomicrobium sp.]|nr:GtrA family protein [Rhizomicrobium sp.]